MMHSPTDIQKHKALTTLRAIEYLIAHGQPINTSYTEENLAVSAGTFTGYSYHPGQIADAAADLILWFSDVCSMDVGEYLSAHAEDTGMHDAFRRALES